MRKSTYWSSLLKVVPSPQASPIKKNHFSSWPIYAKPGAPYYLCKALISRRLDIGRKASLKVYQLPLLENTSQKSTVVQYFLVEIFAKLWFVWSIEHEEKLIFEVANTKEVGTLFTQLCLCYGAVQDCRVNNIQIRNFALRMPLCRIIYCGLKLIPTQCTLRAPQEDFAWRS